VLEMMRVSNDELRGRAERIVDALKGRLLRLRVATGRAQIGGGTLPRSALPSVTIEVDHPTRGAQAMAARLREQPHVQLDVGRIPVDWPAGWFDLIVLSEVGYYCENLAALADRISTSLTEDGTLLLVHWRWPAADHPLTAETVHATIRERTGLQLVVAHSEADFLLEVLSRSGRSVAQRDGLVR